jgi:nucleotide-binding universal stress UspA family protein
MRKSLCKNRMSEVALSAAQWLGCGYGPSMGEWAGPRENHGTMHCRGRPLQCDLLSPHWQGPCKGWPRETVMRFNRILVPTDFSLGAEVALDSAIELAKKFEATVVLMHAYGIPPYGSYPGLETFVTAAFVDAVEQAARDALSRVVATRKGADVPIAAALYCGVASEQILRAVQEHHIELVVMATRGRRGMAHVLVGSDRIVRLSPVPVLVVHPPAEALHTTDK